MRVEIGPLPTAVRWFLNLLLLASIVYAVFAGGRLLADYFQLHGFLKSPYAPFGDDFVNLSTTGRLQLSGGLEKIYVPRLFMDFQHGFIDHDIGLRLWAYPPHTLLFTWLAGLGGYFLTFWIWSVLGLAFLAVGARRFGFGWRETTILVLCPASLQCVSNGQTGNLACGLMLLVLSEKSVHDRSSVIGAALLTMKPQIGFLLPLLWLVRRRWSLIIGTVVIAVILVGLSLILFGLEPWRDYIGATLPELSKLERDGSGPFVLMIPSYFMSLRLLGVDGNAALSAHFVAALVILAVLALRLPRIRDPRSQASLVLIGTCLVTPYLHIYDLGILLAGSLLLLNTVRDGTPLNNVLSAVAVCIGWSLPDLVKPLGLMDRPLSPILMAFIFAVAVCSYGRTADDSVPDETSASGLSEATPSSRS
jgi:hypothetical protein